MVDDMNVEFFYNNGILNRNKLKEKWIMDNLPELFSDIQEFKPILKISPNNFSQIIYHYLNGSVCYPDCEYCGGENKRWQSFSSGYKKGCCKSCAIQLSRPNGIKKRRDNTLLKHGVDHTSKLQSTKSKMRKTNINRYGGVSPSSSEEVLNKIKETNVEKYGCEFPLQNSEIYDKVKISNKKRYGVEFPTQSAVVKDKIKKSNLIKYGVESYSMTDEFRSFMSNNNMEKSLLNISEMNLNIEIISYNDKDFNIHCNVCENESSINRPAFYLRVNRYKTNPCPICNPMYDTYVSNMEIEMVEFLKSKNIEYIQSFREYGKEIDIYLPHYKLGIEMNGNYWHSEIFKDKGYHQSKSLFFNENGIRLIQIWESDWKFKKDIIESIILSKIGKNEEIIYARKCNIIELSNKETISFLKENHLQGYVNAKVCFGLEYNGDLVSIMTFTPSKNRHIKNEGYWELVRFCNKLNTTVIGGAERLLSKFKSDNTEIKLVSYAKFDYTSIGKNIYSKLGFKLEKITEPGFYWCKGLERHYRFTFKKSKLIKDGFDPNLSGSQIMYNRGYYKSWDSGNLKFIL